MLIDATNLKADIHMNSNNHSKSVSKRKGKRAPDETLYTASEAAQRIGVPPSTFQNYVRAGKIHRTVPLGKKEGFYPKEEVERFARDLQSHPSSRRRAFKLEQPAQEKIEQEAATDWIRYEDELNAYNLDCELYGFENSVSPDITWTWWQKIHMLAEFSTTKRTGVRSGG